MVEGIDYLKTKWWGEGLPTLTHKSGLPGRRLQDGGGFCSPGRWKEQDRRFPPQAAVLTLALDSWIEGLDQGLAEKLVFQMMAGRFSEEPLLGKTQALSQEVLHILRDAGLSKPPGLWKRGQVVDHGLLHMLGEFLEDPDYSCMQDFSQGVARGVETPLPRTAAIWPPKSKWPLEPFENREAIALNSNYPSALIHQDVLVKDLEEQRELGWVVRMILEEAQKKYGEVFVAPLAVLEEKGGQQGHFTTPAIL